MAFRLFKRRDDQPATAEVRDNVSSDSPSDVLLTAIMNGNGISRAQALTIPAVEVNLLYNYIIQKGVCNSEGETVLSFWMNIIGLANVFRNNGVYPVVFF